MVNVACISVSSIVFKACFLGHTRYLHGLVLNGDIWNELK